MKNYIPHLLLYSRLALALFIFLFTYFSPSEYPIFILVLMYYGILSDIFDGIIARRLGISTKNFRQLDTIFDLLFFFSIFYYISVHTPNFFEDYGTSISIILVLEAGMYLISLLRFKKAPSPHSIPSKFWGILLIIEFSLLILKVPGNHFQFALIYGMLVHLDRVLIYALLKKWDHDVPSSYHAYLLRKGIPITRKKLFNG